MLEVSSIRRALQPGFTHVRRRSYRFEYAGHSAERQRVVVFSTYLERERPRTSWEPGVQKPMKRLQCRRMVPMVFCLAYP